MKVSRSLRNILIMKSVLTKCNVHVETTYKKIEKSLIPAYGT